MKTKFKKVLALVLAFIMIVGTVPVSALAEEGGGGQGQGQSNTIGPVGGAAGEPEENPLSEEIRAYCDEIFAPGGEYWDLGSVYVEGPVHAEGDAGEYYAGETIKYEVYYDITKAAPTWSKGYEGRQTLYDGYKIYLSFTLPAGLKLIELPGFDVTFEENDDGSRTYTGMIETAADASTYKVTMSVYIAGNGTAESIADYAGVTVDMDTSFTVLNKESEPYEAVGDYTVSTSDVSDGFGTTTRDEWGVQKDTVGEVVLDTVNGKTVAKVTYKVALGMKNGSGEQQKEIGQFQGTGRTAIESMILRDVLVNDETVFIDYKTGAPVTSPFEGSAISATIKKQSRAEDGSIVYGEPVEITSGEEIVIVGDGSEEDLALETVSLDYDHIYEKGKNIFEKRDDVPSRTEYLVEAVYELKEGAIADFDKLNNWVKFRNDVELDSVLYGKDYSGTPEGKDHDEDSAWAEKELPKKGKAGFSISKDLKDYNGGTSKYSGEYGAIGYELKYKDGEGVPVVYKDAAGTEPVAAGEKLEAGRTYYVIPNQGYVVEEELSEEQAAAMRQTGIKYSCGNTESAEGFSPKEGETWSVVITNEEKAADIRVHKSDDKNAALSGAKFELLRSTDGGETWEAVTDKDGKAVTAVSSGSGIATFTKVPYGLYKVNETETPAGYTGAYESDALEINSNTDIEINGVVNSKTTASLQLTKHLGTAEADSKMGAAKNFGEDKATFKLMRRMKGDTHEEEVTEDVYGRGIPTVVDSSTGTINVTLPAYIETAGGTRVAYEYWFVEDIKDSNIYNPYGSESKKVTLVDASGAALRNTQTVDMYNRNKVKISITKKFYDVSSASKLTENKDLTTEVTLYTYAGGVMTPVGDAQEAGYGKTATWSGLELYSGSTKKSYYINEADVEGYALDVTKSGVSGQVEIEGKTYIPVAVSGATASKTLYNVQQQIPVTIYKKNYYTKAFVSGAGVTVYEGEVSPEKIAADAKSGGEIKDKAIPDGNGLTVYLAPGKEYKIVETANTTGLTRQNATEEEPLEIDLKDVQQTYGSGKPAVKTATVYNKPDPNIKITKASSPAVSTTALKNKLKTAEFTVYTKTGEDEYTPVEKEGGSRIVIPGSGSLSGVRLPAGEYYLLETKVPDGWIDPDVMPGQYGSSIVRGTSAEDGKEHSFFKLTVKDAAWTETGTADNTFSATITNIRNAGNLRVYKYIDGAAAKVAGFIIRATGSDGKTYTQKTTANYTYVTFSSLPVYDPEGKLIEYTITEDAIPESLADSYCKSAQCDGQKATLQLNKTVSTDTSNKPLKVNNETLIRVKVTKLRVNTWEHDFTGIAYLMGGVTVGLYQKETTEGTEGNPGTAVWKLVETAVTGGMGTAVFDAKLRRDGEYAVLEVDCPESYRMYPDGDKKLAKDAGGAALEEISDAELDQYNKCDVTAEQIKKAGAANDYTADAGSLINKNHWVQFDITKWLDADELGSKYTDEEGNEQTLTTSSVVDIDETKDTRLDNAVFELYSREMGEGERNAEFNYATATSEGWSLVGTYTSGTEYNPDGSRAQGGFVTDIQQGVNDKCVYVLVEKNAGPTGAKMYDYYKQTFYSVAEGSGLKYSSNIARQVAYELDRKNEDDILNATPSGGGGGYVMLTSIRLAKWADMYDRYVNADGNEVEVKWSDVYNDDGTLKADGPFGGNYVPLPNAKFEVRLADDPDVVIAELTSGLDATRPSHMAFGADRAWAQSGVFGLKVTEGEDGKLTGTLIDYQVENAAGSEQAYKTIKDLPVTVMNEDTREQDGYTVYGILTQVVEVEAPEGYSYSEISGEMYLCFVSRPDTDTWYFNDAYFVKTEAAGAAPLSTTQQGPTWYITDAKSGTGDGSEALGPGPQYRITDFRTHSAAVVLTKYGYVPDKDTLSKTSVELDSMSSGEIGRTALAGVRMKLEKIGDSTFTIGDTGSNEFVTDVNGSYNFPDGLEAGRYRVTELSGSGEYENSYGMPGLTKEFEVTSGMERLRVSMYNPLKGSLTVTKKDTSGNVLEGVAITLGDDTVKTGADGKAEFDSRDSGAYGFSESTDEYSIEYLYEYLNGKYPGLVEIVEEGGVKSVKINVGFTYASATETIVSTGKQKFDGSGGREEASSVGTDVVVTEINGLTDGELCVIDPAIELVNPVFSDLSLEKKDENDADAKVTGAEFEVKYLKFDTWSGDVTVSGRDWTAVGTKTTGTDGKITMTDCEPGIYSFRETKAPAGYEIIKDAANNDIIYYVVLTGGMPVSIGEGALATTSSYYDINGEEHVIKTLFKDEEASFTALNRGTVKAKATKEVTKGELTEELEWTVTLNLKDSSGSTAGTAVITDKTSGAVYFQNGGKDTELSFGNPYAGGEDPAYSVYYLEEELPAGGNYGIAKVKAGGKELTAESEGTFKGMYAISVEDLEEISIEVTNRYLRGEILFAKRDSRTPAETLSGAQFKVCYKDAGGNWADLSDCSVTELVDDDGVLTGIYRADIHLVDGDEHTYGVFETVAPNHYIVNRDLHVEAELSADNNSEDYSKDTDKLLNTQSVKIGIEKYDNIKGSAAKAPAPAAAGDASFLLLKKTDSGWEIAPTLEVTIGADGKIIYNEVVSEKAIDAQGEVLYDVEPGRTYGFIEYSYNKSKYAGISGVYYVNGSEVEKDGTFEASGKTYDVYTLGELEYGAEDIKVEVYNIPLLKAKIVKKDIGGYPDNVIPQTEFSIYDVTDRDAAEGVFVPDGENVLTLTADEKVLSGDTSEVDGSTTYYEWTERDPGRHYVVVETKVKSHDGQTYDTLNKDYKGVVWYADIPVMADPDPLYAEVFELKNVYSEADVKLSKKIAVNGEEVDSSSVESLLKSGCDVEYVLKPEVESHNQALHSFSISDSGVSFTQPSKQTEYKGKLPEYSIEKLVIGSASHDVSKFSSSIGNDFNINVKCTFYTGLDCTGEVTGVKTTDVTTGCEITGIPEGSKSFKLEYYSEGVRTSTQYSEGTAAEDDESAVPAQGYSLGYGFTAGDIRVFVKVDKLGDDGEEPTAEVKDFSNSAVAELTYPKWSNDGMGTEIVTRESSDKAATTVEGIKLPIADVQKENSVRTENKVTTARYSITVTNRGDGELVNPIVLDTLPTGVTYKSGSVEGGQIEKGTSIERSCDYTVEEEQYTGEATLIVDGEKIGASETAVVFKLTGCRLAGGESTTIEFDAVVSESAVIYGDTLENFVYLSSAEKGYRTEGNEHGYPFAVGGQPGSYDFGMDLEDSARDMSDNIKKGSSASKREEALRKALGSYEGDGYEWVKAWAETPSDVRNALTVKKAVRADKDEAAGFRDEDSFLAHATRTNPTASEEQSGWVDYRLTVFNGGDNAECRYMTVGDVLPSYNNSDGRDSRWDSVMDSITTVTLNGVSTTAYTVYYYTGAGAQSALTSAQNLSAEGKTDWAGYKTELEAAGWTAEPADVTAATAFLIVFDEDQVLAQNDYIVVTYHTTTEVFTSAEDGEFSSRAAFQNANNTFKFSFVQTQNKKDVVKSLESNTVKTTLMDREVSVEGDVWIDEDWDSTQQAPGDERAARDYSEYAIIKKLKSAISVDLTDERITKDPSHIQKVTDESELEARWDEVGESIKHFAFDNLGASSPKNGVDEDGVYTGSRLDTKKLKTTDPYNYSLKAVISGEDAELINSIFKLTGTGENHYKSDNPDTFGNKDDPKANELDSNFYEGTSAYVTSPFYIRYSDLIDNSKDIGFRMYRDLEIYKTDITETTGIEGAKFSIYGPFEEGTVESATAADLEELCTSDKLCSFTAVTEESAEEPAEGEAPAEPAVKEYVLDESGAGVTELVTGTDGKIEIRELNWWKEYIICETEPAEGYTINAAEAKGVDGTEITELPGAGYWGLGIPGTEKVEKLDKVTVTNESLGKIKIVKNLADWKAGAPSKIFVFSVTAYKENKETHEYTDVVYSDVLTMNFTGPDTKAIEVDNLPVGSKIVVKEIYSGAEFDLVAGEREQVIAYLPPWDDGYDDADPEAEPGDEGEAEPGNPIFTFGNAWSRRKVVSGGVVNEFENDGENWKWNGRSGQNSNDGPIHAKEPDSVKGAGDEGGKE